MGFAELFLLAVGLSMDAFAVSVCKGLATKKLKLKHAVICGIWFGGFQGVMPFIGYVLGTSFASYITNIAPWIAFVLLSIIGANMIKESLCKDDEKASESLDFKTMFLMAVATSIDALAAGVTFSFTQVDIWQTIAIIGVTTFVFSVLGLKIGNLFGCRYKKNAEFVGGAILIIIGLKILIEHF